MDRYLLELFCMFLLYSFAGWVMEVLLLLINKHKFINRGFLIGPICPIYGFGCITLELLLHRYLDNPFGLFCTSIVICSVLEYFTSYIMEKLFKARWWDYSNIPYNVEGRICLKNSIAFGFLGSFIVYVLNPYIFNFLDKFEYNFLKYVSCSFFILLIIDFVVSLRTIIGLEGTLLKYSKDNTEEISKKVKNKIMEMSLLHRRLFDAYPNVKIRNRIKERIKKYKKNR